MLKKIEFYIQPFKLEVLKDALIKVGVEGMSVSKVEGFGKQRGYLEHEIPDSQIKFLRKTKLEIIVDENIVEDVARLIVNLAHTGKIGSGKIFILPVEDAIRIRTSESGINALI